MNRARTLIAGALLVAGLGSAGEGLWIHLKARLAQGLTLWAWQRTLAGEERARPWPWADTWPVARLAAPEQGIDLLVLSGVSGRSLAFGPGHLNGTPPPGAEGNSVVAGHRDTHFRFLRRLAPGDEVSVVTASGAERRYRVVAARVTGARDPEVLDPTGPTRLTLVTCYPFDSLMPGGPLRYVVTAEAVGAAVRSTG